MLVQHALSIKQPLDEDGILKEAILEAIEKRLDLLTNNPQLESINVLLQHARSVKEPEAKNEILEAIEKLINQPTNVPQQETFKVLLQHARKVLLQHARLVKGPEAKGNLDTRS